ncbi:MAG: hypothetical protein U0414_36420 [Polyangiaceae bacterium]
MKNRSITQVCAFALVAALGCTLTMACSNKPKDDAGAEEEDTSSPPPTSTTPAANKGSSAASTGGGETTKPTSTTPAPTESGTATAPPAAGIEAHVKAELDGKTEGTKGDAVLAKDTKASVQVPSAWKKEAKGDVSTATSADGKQAIAVSAYDGSAPKLDAAAAAIGLTGCKWGTVENVTVGKDKLAGIAADGVCTKGGASVHTAYLGDLTDNFLVVGVWDNDMKSVFDSMRSIAKTADGPDPIAACCNALNSNMLNAPAQQKLIYAAAIAACNNLKGNAQGRAALGAVRSLLVGVAAPGTCN